MCANKKKSKHTKKREKEEERKEQEYGEIDKETNHGWGMEIEETLP